MKHDLKDITFIIPFYLENDERRENLHRIEKFLSGSFDTNFFFIQSYRGKQEKIPMAHFYVHQEGEIFHRTQIINTAIKKANTPFVCIYDTDTIFPIHALLKAAHLLRMGDAMVYPYDGRFIDIERSYLQDGIIKEAVSFATESKGGAVFLNKADYLDAGLENENIIGWGPEDAERYQRMKTLGYSIERVDGKCWHITHPRGINSSPANPNTATNNAEYEKVKAMNKEELQAYIKTWPWLKQ